jgi:hypothetical protein
VSSRELIGRSGRGGKEGSTARCSSACESAPGTYQHSASRARCGQFPANRRLRQSPVRGVRGEDSRSCSACLHVFLASTDSATGARNRPGGYLASVRPPSGSRARFRAPGRRRIRARFDLEATPPRASDDFRENALARRALPDQLLFIYPRPTSSIVDPWEIYILPV